jgi:DNA-3-methyladenine glycosylase
MEDILKISLPGEFYNRDTSEVAAGLLGKALVKYSGREIVGGLIVETEAYYGQEDPASHAYGGKTPRSGIMFGKPGIAYVYLCYGMYYLLNIVTESEGNPGAVLIRALEPVWGIDIMKRRRKKACSLADGPGRLTMALGIDKNDNGADIVNGEKGLYVFESSKEKNSGKEYNAIEYNNHEVIRTSRIGIKKGSEMPLRFLLHKKRNYN